MVYLTGIPENHTMRRNIAVHVSARCYQHVVTDDDFPYHRSVHTYPHTISYLGCTFPCSTVLLADGDSFMQITPLANLCIRIDGNVICVTQIQTLANLTTVGYLKAIA